MRKKKTTRKGTTGKAKKRLQSAQSDKPLVGDDTAQKDVTEEKVDTEPKPVNEGGDEQTLPKDENSDEPIQDNDYSQPKHRYTKMTKCQ